MCLLVWQLHVPVTHGLCLTQPMPTKVTELLIALADS